MPVKSSSSSVVRWPDRATVDAAVRAYAIREASVRPGLVRLGYFGSYARGDWGPGSDLDLVAVLDSCAAPFERRALDWDLNTLPVAADLLVYTLGEWQALMTRGGRFARTVSAETIWVFDRDDRPPTDRPSP